MKTFKLCLFLLLLCVGIPLWGSSTPNVPIDDPAYRDIDKLVALGLVKDAIYGQRPWSRREFARMVANAENHLQEIPVPLAPDDREISPRIAAFEILERLKSRFHEELTDAGTTSGEQKTFRLHPLEKVRFDYTILDSPSRPFSINNGLGNLNAASNPLTAYSEGRHYVDGNTLGLETTHAAKLTPYLSLYARPRFEILFPSNGSTEFNPLFQQVYAKFAYRNFELEVGRDSLIWGQGEFGGLMFSNNARPLDMIKMTSSAPFFHPWIFRYLGPSKYTFFIANLGPEADFPYAFLFGIRASARPVSFLELGFNHTIIMGGDGAPAIKWFDPISEFFFVRRGGVRGQGSQLADHRFGIDWRLRIPWMRNSEWYFEALWDDFGRETISANITEQMGFTSGFYIPRMTPDGWADLRLEYSHIPPVFYRHGTWRSGYSLNRNLLGLDGGPDNDEIDLRLGFNLDRNHRLRFDFIYRNTDNDTYTQSLSSNGAPDRVVKIADGPTEHRFQAQTRWSWDITENFGLEIGIGYERALNFNFSKPDDRNNFGGSLRFAFNP